MFKKLNNVSKIFIILFVLFNIILVVEFGLRVTLPAPGESKFLRDKKNYQTHPDLVLQNLANTAAIESKQVNDVFVYKNIRYSFDSYHRRKTWSDDGNKHKAATLFFGSSITFGKGIADKDTLASYYAYLNRSEKVYNYAVRSWGTQQYLQLLKLRDFAKEVPHPIEKVFFVISVNRSGGHVQRFKGTLDTCSPCKWLDSLPVFKKKGEEYVGLGKFSSNFPVLFSLYENLQKLKLVRILLKYFTLVGADDYNDYVDFLKYLNRVAQEKFPQAKIYFVNHPFSNEESSDLLREAKGYNELLFADMSGLVDQENFNRFSFGINTPHPSTLLNEVLAMKLTEFSSKPKRGPCPFNYSLVPVDPETNVRPFCIMKYEAKRDPFDLLSEKPVALANQMPWANISRDGAVGACRSLGKGFDLVSNRQWQVMAWNLEKQPRNWSSGELGKGCLFNGNSGIDNICGYDGENPEKGYERSPQSRLTFSNGEEVWNLAGNLWEWVRDQNDTIYSPRVLMSDLYKLKNLPVGSLGDGVGRTAQTQFGSKLKASQSSTDVFHRGMGRGWLEYKRGGILRGGRYGREPTENLLSGLNPIHRFTESVPRIHFQGYFPLHYRPNKLYMKLKVSSAGLFATALDPVPEYSAASAGFRCVYQPEGLD